MDSKSLMAACSVLFPITLPSILINKTFQNQKVTSSLWDNCVYKYSKASWDTASWDTDLAGTRFWNRSKIFSDTLIFDFFLSDTRFFMVLYIFFLWKCTVFKLLFFFLQGFSPLMLYFYIVFPLKKYTVFKLLYFFLH